ncbi:MAG: YeeE/YedE thiosulfate transporter family protein [Gemmatimonadales bacterium]
MTGSEIAIALVIGVGFGFFLEQGGMGSARKLAGQFYLTDFAVLKVMFSAILTAMLGLFWLGRLGLVDVGRVFVPETYLWPHLIGGAVFGLGFVMGGLCPGTSCVAASTGRLDGVALMLGMGAGIVVFNEGFARVASFYDSSPLGTVTLGDLAGVSPGLAVLAVVVAALGAFRLAEAIERRRAAR